jgi:hypothetical protein
MIRSYHHPRPLGIALAAVLGMLSVAGGASACEAKRATKALPSCCVGGPSGTCGGCCGPAEAEAPAVPTAVGRSVEPAAIEIGHAVPSRSCECRSDEPAPLAPRLEPRPSPGRPDHDRASVVAFSFEGCGAAGSIPPVARVSGPPHTPLYLRMSRLLI